MSRFVTPKGQGGPDRFVKPAPRSETGKGPLAKIADLVRPTRASKPNANKDSTTSSSE